MTAAWTPPPPAAPAIDAPGASGVGSAEATSDVRVASVLVGLLLAVGALLGLVWAWWSPPRMASVVYANGDLLPDTDSYDGHRQEAWIAGDGRFLILVAVAGLAAAFGAWFLRPGNRGAIVAAALGVGGVGGALLTDLVGYLAGGGDSAGRYHVQLTDGTTERYTKELPLWVHATGLLALEAGLAVLVYLVLVAFAARDDLGRPDPVRDRSQRIAPPPPPWPQGPASQSSVDPGAYPQHGWGYGDASGTAQQGEFPPGQFRDAP